MQQLILELEDESKFFNKKFKGAGSFFTAETKAIADAPQSPDPFFPVTQHAPLATPSPDKSSVFSLQSSTSPDSASTL